MENEKKETRVPIVVTNLYIGLRVAICLGRQSSLLKANSARSQAPLETYGQLSPKDE